METVMSELEYSADWIIDASQYQSTFGVSLRPLFSFPYLLFLHPTLEPNKQSIKPASTNLPTIKFPSSLSESTAEHQLTQQQTFLDWQYQTVPQTSADSNAQTIRAGRCLGGSTAINGLAWSKPHDFQIDAMETVGNSGLNWASLQGYVSLLFFSHCLSLFYKMFELAQKKDHGWYCWRSRLIAMSQVFFIGFHDLSFTKPLQKVLTDTYPQMQRAEGFTPPGSSQAANGLTYRSSCHGTGGPISTQYDPSAAPNNIESAFNTTVKNLGLPYAT